MSVRHHSRDTLLAQDQADRWNEQHPVGTPVRYWAGFRAGEGCLSRTRSAAAVICDSAVVWIEKEASGISLSHVAVVTEADLAPGTIRYPEPFGSSHEARCPFCGTRDRAARSAVDGEEIPVSCGRCGAGYLLTVHLSVSYTSQPLPVKG